MKNFNGAAKRITDLALPRAAHRIGVGEDEIHAVIEVETSGSGFDSKGRPKMLFEPHVFYRNLKGVERNIAVQQGIAYPNQGQKAYPKDSYPRLMRAIEINATAALRSASWGLPQILGENHAIAGYDTVQDMVADFLEDEEAHLQAMISFCISNKIDGVLRHMASLKRPTVASDCVDFVKVYNGPRYRINQYDTKMARAHNKWRAIRDTPFNPNKDLVLSDRVAVVSDPTAVRAAQKYLRDLGYPEVGEADGIMGKRTRNTILTFEADNGIPLTGAVSFALLDYLEVAPKRGEAPSRSQAKAVDLINRGDEIVKSGDLMKKIGAGILAASGLGGIAEGVIDFDRITAGLTGFSGALRAIAGVPNSVWFAIGGAALLYFGSKVVSKQVKAYREGRSV